MMSSEKTRGQILDVALELAQRHGFDGFSYADIAERVGIRKASIHHHFPTKSGLGVKLIEKFRADCAASLAGLSGADPQARLEGYVELFRETLRAGRMCLCGILSAGFTNLSDEVKAALIAAINEQEEWFAQVIVDGQAEACFRDDIPPRSLARNFIAGLEGLLLLARVFDHPSRFEAGVGGLIDGIKANPRSGSLAPGDQG